jgi:hypothetical protein
MSEGKTLEQMIQAAGGLNAVRRIMKFKPKDPATVHAEIIRRLGDRGIVRNKAGIFVMLVIDQP